MKLTAIKTDLIHANDFDLLELVDRYVQDMPRHSVLAITSKVVSLCEGRVIKIGSEPKEDIVRREAEYYLPPEFNPYGVMVTINRGVMIAGAGIDESNGDGNYILWPRDPQASANRIRDHLRKRFGHEVGVLITDSRLTPLRWGIIGLGLAHSGFAALEDYVGQMDAFGNYKMKYSYGSVIDGLAVAAVLEMGEGAQQTPLALIEDAAMVRFQDRNPTEAELDKLRIEPGEDLFAEMLKKIPWDKRPGKD